MAHSSNNDVTSKNIGAYPLPKMQEYNSYLLKIPQTVTSTEELLKILKNMSEEERAALLAYSVLEKCKKRNENTLD